MSDHPTGGTAAPASCGRSTLAVLGLTTNESGFYRGHTDALAALGVRRRTLAVPGNPRSSDVDRPRSVGDYLRFFPVVYRNAGDGYDLIHANYGLTGPMALAELRLPVVLTLWGSDLMGPYGWLSRACARLSDEVIVMSRGMADRLDRDCHVIPHGVDFERFRPLSRTDARRRIGWDDDARHVLFPYVPTRDVKNYPRAERVVAAARDRLDVPVELEVVNGVPHEEIHLYVNAADALVLTSEREGSPNAVKEALACNVPVVSTDVGDVSELLADVEPSYVCHTDEELVDGLVDVLASPRRSNGRAAVEHVRLEATAGRVRDVYEAALEGNRRGTDR